MSMQDVSIPMELTIVGVIRDLPETELTVKVGEFFLSIAYCKLCDQDLCEDGKIQQEFHCNQQFQQFRIMWFSN